MRAERVGQPEASGGEAFKEGFREGAADAQHLAGGFHLRAEDGVCVRELFKGEYRHLHGVVGRRAI